MHDSGKIIAGIVIFLAIATSPLWYNAVSGRASYTPELKYPEGEKNCVESKEFMNTHHMDLLDEWRNDVVRYGIVHPKGRGKNDFEIDDIVEKPGVDQAPSRLAVASRYVFSAEIFDAL